jgi:hypothetical protein
MKIRALTAALIFLAATTTLAQAEILNFNLSAAASGFVTAQDESPDAFSFISQTRVHPGSTAIAAPDIIVSGLGDGVSVLAGVSGNGDPQFRLDTGSGFGDLLKNGTVKNGDVIRLSLLT